VLIFRLLVRMEPSLDYTSFFSKLWQIKVSFALIYF